MTFERREIEKEMAKTKKRRLGESLLASLIIALACIAVFSGGLPLETRLARAGLAQQGFSAFADSATAEEAMLLDHYGIDALLAERRYPGIAAQLFARYGETEEWQRIIRTYGYHQVVPIVWRFWSAESVAFTAKRHVGAALTIATTRTLNAAKRAVNWFRSQTGSSKPQMALTTLVVSWPPTPLTSAERAWLAICRIDESDNNMLGRYAVDEQGVARTLRFQTGLAIVEEVAFKEFLGIERKLALGKEKEVTLANVVGAALELSLAAAVTYGVSRSVAKATFSQRFAWRTAGSRLSKTARTTGSFALGLAMLVPKSLLAKAAKTGAVMTALYVVWRNPGVLHELFGDAAVWFGYSRWLGQMFGWTLLFFPILSFFSFLWWPITMYVVWPITRRSYLALASRMRQDPAPA